MTMKTGGIDEACGATATMRIGAIGATATTDHDTAVTKIPYGIDGAMIVTGLGLTGIKAFVVKAAAPDSLRR
ncbi:MAG: hypothetical protein ACM3IH_04260 [Sphingobacteriales bacterium]